MSRQTRRRGRARNVDARRHPSGQKYTPRNERPEIVPQAALDRRAELLAMDRGDARALMRTDGASNIGIVFAHGLILEHQRRAAQALAMTHARWLMAAEIPRPHPKSATLFSSAICDDEACGEDGSLSEPMTDVDLIRAEVCYEKAMSCIPRGLKMELVAALVIDSACITQTAPRLFDKASPIGKKLAAELRSALDILAGHYRIPVVSEKVSKVAA